MTSGLGVRSGQGALAWASGRPRQRRDSLRRVLCLPGIGQPGPRNTSVSVTSAITLCLLQEAQATPGLAPLPDTSPSHSKAAGIRGAFDPGHGLSH